MLDQPLRAIAANAGEDGAVVVNRVRGMKSKTEGFDADKCTYCDLYEAGIIDPAKVVKTSLQNAASVACSAADDLRPGDRHPEGRGRGRSRRP